MVVPKENGNEVGEKVSDILENVKFNDFDIKQSRAVGKSFNAIRTGKIDSIYQAAHELSHSISETMTPEVIKESVSEDIPSEVPVENNEVNYNSELKIRRGLGKVKMFDSKEENNINFVGDADKDTIEKVNESLAAAFGSSLNKTDEKEKIEKPGHMNSSVFGDDNVKKSVVEPEVKTFEPTKPSPVPFADSIQNKVEEDRNNSVVKINDNAEREILQKARNVVAHEDRKSLLDQYRELSKQISDAQSRFVEKQEDKKKKEEEKDELTRQYSEKKETVVSMQREVDAVLEKQRLVLNSINGDISKVDEDSLALTQNIDEIVKNIKQLEGEEKSYRDIINEGNSSLEEVEKTRGRTV